MTNNKTKRYTGDDISVLSDVEYVRLRTHNYFGDTSLTEKEVPFFSETGVTCKTFSFVPAALKALEEIIDNCIDEFHESEHNAPILKIEADPEIGRYKISDNGRGVPIEKHKVAKKHVPEVVFSQLKSGRNFKNNKTVGVRGQNGVGSACVNFCSEYFNVTITRDNKKYYQEFKNGCSSIQKPKIVKAATAKTGTTIEFKLDPEVFKSVTIPEELIVSKCYDLALSNPRLQVEYQSKNVKLKVKYATTEKGLSHHLKSYANVVVISNDNVTTAFVPNFHDDYQEKVFGWVNSGYLLDGGLCNSQLSNAFISFIEKSVANSADLKKLKKTIAIDKTLVRSGLAIFNFVNVSDPQYDAQHKSRYTGPTLRKVYDEIIRDNTKTIERKTKEWRDSLQQKIIDQLTQGMAKKIQRENKQRSQTVIPGFLDATSKRREDTFLLITEGKSASGEIKNVRNSKVHAVYELRGKVNNVYGSTVRQLNKMGKLQDLMAVLNLTPGKNVKEEDLNFGHIVISTDADFDGDDIFTLLVNMFYQFWPELLKKGNTKVYRLVAPNIVASKGKVRKHFQTREEFEKHKSKLNGYSIEYMKGLGSMAVDDWKQILSDLPSRIIPIEDDGKLGETLDLLFNSRRSDDRKKWLGGDK